MSFHFGRLKFSSMKIENFRQYYGENSIEFSIDEKKPFTIIKGTNGAGKTNIMNAITWCFFGKELYMDQDNREFATINQRSYNETGIDKILTTSVTIELSDDNGPRYKIFRKIKLFKTKKSEEVIPFENMTIPGGTTPSISKKFSYYDKEKGWTFSEYFENEISKILPESFANYFLFDGEKLEEFFDKIGNVKEGLEDVSRIVITEKALDHLEKFTTKIRSEVKDLGSEMKELQADIDEEEKEKTRISKEITPLFDENKNLKNEIIELETVILQNKDTEQLQRDESRLKKEIEGVEDLIANQETKRYDYILKQYPIVVLSKEINAAIDEINLRYDKGELPPKIKRTFIKELLSEHECICGNEILEGSSEFEKLKKLQNIIAMSSIDNLSKELKYELGDIKNNDVVSVELDQFLKRTLKLDKMKKGLDLQLEIAKKDLIGKSKKDIKEIIEKKDKIEKKKENLLREIGSLEEQQKDCDLTLAKHKREFDQKIRDNKKNSYEIKKIDWCEDAIENLTNIKNNLLLEVKKKVEKNTTDNFLKLVWKKKTFDKVKIDSEYEIKVHHLDDKWILNSLSKGEKLVLAMAFVSALRNVTNLQFPLIIDTPTGRVDGEPRVNIAKYLPEFLEKQRVTMLMTYSEYSNKIEDKDLKKSFEPFRDIIASKVGKENTLEYNDETRCTKIN